MSSNYHDQTANNKHHYKSHRENNAKNKFVIYVEKKQNYPSDANAESRPETKQEEISNEKKKDLIEKALESYEKSQEKAIEKNEFFQNKDRGKINLNYQKKQRNQRQDFNSKSLSYNWTNEEKIALIHHNENMRAKKEISKEKMLREFEKAANIEANEKIKEFFKNYPDCFSLEVLLPENNSDVLYNIRDAFSKNNATTQENSMMNKHSYSHHHQNRNYEETLPAWADYDINDKSNKRK